MAEQATSGQLERGQRISGCFRENLSNSRRGCMTVLLQSNRQTSRREEIKSRINEQMRDAKRNQEARST